MSPPASPFAAPEPWDLVADGYADEAPWLMAPFSARAIELVAPHDGVDVVDVACGPGTTSLLVAPRVRSVRAVDFSAAMIDRMQRDLRARGLDNVKAEQGDGQALPFADASFDVAFSMFGLMFFPDRKKGFAELVRVLRAGGTAVVSSWAPFDTSPLMQAMFGAVRAADPSIPEPTRVPTSLENPSVLEHELREAGFSSVRIVPHTVSIPIGDPDTLWKRMVQSSAPLALMRRKLGEDAWLVRSQIARAWLRERVRDVTTLSTTAYLGVGVK